ncbi:MAG: thioredoxin family protein [Thermoplasmata archaeon]
MEIVRPAKIVLVYAHWCPHCVPVSTEPVDRLGALLGVPVQLLDIDVPGEEIIADELVKRYGDWVEDYLIPQVFLEWSDGRVEHLLTGTPGSLDGTRRNWQRLLDRSFSPPPVPR